MRRINRDGKPSGIHAGSWLCALALACFSLTGHAGYANAVPPSGWSAGTGAGATYRAAANETWLSSTVRTNAALNVGGKAVQVPATMRLAANAPRFAARFLFTNPYVAVGSAVLTAWLANEGLHWNSSLNRWERQIPGSPGSEGEFEYSVSIFSPNAGPWQPSKSSACTAECAVGGLPVSVASNDTTCQCNGPGYNPVGPYNARRISTPPTDPVRQPVGDIEFEEKMAPTTLPETAPNIIPMPWPVEMPKLNPVPSPNGQPQPIRIPTGDPYKVPNTDPAEYRRPAIDIVPSPTPQAPWRVDVQPKEIPVPDLQPRPLPPPVPIVPPMPNPDPNAPPQPDVDPNAPPQKGEDKQPDLCEKNPDILACQKPELDTPAEETPKKSFVIRYVEETLFGVGSCPANRSVTIGGHQMTVWDFQKTCDYLALYVKPLLITLATFSAFFILSPGKNE